MRKRTAVVLLPLLLLALGTGCRQVRQTAFDAWAVPSTGIPEYNIEAETAEPNGLMSLQIIDPGFSESEAKQVAASVIESRRSEHPAIAILFVSADGERRALYAEDATAVRLLRFSGVTPEEADASGYPFLGFLRSG